MNEMALLRVNYTSAELAIRVMAHIQEKESRYWVEGYRNILVLNRGGIEFISSMSEYNRRRARTMFIRVYDDGTFSCRIISKDALVIDWSDKSDEYDVPLDRMIEIANEFTKEWIDD